jgi:phospholipid/cholesterol/gamma-HCH transport system substrate-binding protein
MKRLRAPIIVGLVGILAIISFVLLFGTVRKDIVGKGEGYRVSADFDDVSGLASHSRVTMSGVPVGTMETIELVTLPEGVTKARVWIRLENRIELYRGIPGPGGVSMNAATITRRAATMLGDYYLEIAPGIGGERIPDGGAIPNVVGEAGIMAIANKLEKASEVFPRIQQIADDVAVVTGSLSAAMGGEEGEARILRIVEDVLRSAQEIAGAAADVRAFVGREVGPDGNGRLDRIVQNIDTFTRDAAQLSRASADDLSRTIRNIEAITENIRLALAQPGAEGEPARLDRAAEKLETSIDNLERATRAIANVAEKVDRGEGSVGKLFNEDTVATKIETVVGDIGSLVDSVSRLKTDVGFRTEFNILQRSVKNYFSLRFVPDKSKYYLLELIWDPRGKTSTVERVTYTNDPAMPAALTERIVETRDSLKVTLQFARRLLFMTGRFGLTESTGGLGLDFEFFNETLRIATDIFDFNGDRYPRLKILTSYTFLNYFYVTAGVDDIVNSRGRDYFVGAGFRFRDDDIKALLFTAPTPSL